MKKKGMMIGVLALLVLAVVALVSLFSPKPQAGDKMISIKIVDELNAATLFDDTISTDAQTLGELLKESEELQISSEESQYGMYITAMMNTPQHDDAYWVFESENKKTCEEAGYWPAADSVMLADGDVFLFKLTNQFN